MRYRCDAREWMRHRRDDWTFMIFKPQICLFDGKICKFSAEKLLKCSVVAYWLGLKLFVGAGKYTAATSPFSHASAATWKAHQPMRQLPEDRNASLSFYFFLGMVFFFSNYDLYYGYLNAPKIISDLYLAIMTFWVLPFCICIWHRIGVLHGVITQRLRCHKKSAPGKYVVTFYPIPAACATAARSEEGQ